MKKDGHIHSPFCPHGTKDTLDEYVEKAIQLGYEEISFTEHAPLPEGFTDSTPTKDSAISIDQLQNYFAEVNRVKQKYLDKINVLVGLEVDYIEGYENEITHFLNQNGKHLDDAILSVHFVKIADDYVCIDYSPDVFEKAIAQCGSVEVVHETYYRTVLKSVHANLGTYKPKRIGHMTLIKKFQQRFPTNKSFHANIQTILLAIKKHNYELDYNGAGTAKPLCRETYPPIDIARQAQQIGIPLIYGSDAHQVKELGQGREQLLFHEAALE